jgi:hypothetical protein
MSQSFFEIEKGLELNASVFLAGTIDPGTGGDSDDVGVGSYYLNTTDGGLFVKITAGTGTDKWAEMATQAFAGAAGGGVDWKDSVRVATDAALPAYVQAGTGVGATLTASAIGILTVDGVAVLLGDSVLVKDEAASPGDPDHGIYECTIEGTAGVAFELTRRTDADEDAEVTGGMAVGVNEGTNNADSYWSLTTNDPITVDTTNLNFTKISDANTIAELGYIRTFIGKTGAGSETPTYSSNNYVVDTTSLETAIGVLDAQLGTTQSDLDTAELAILDAQTRTEAANITGATVIDSVNVDTVAAVKWMVYCEGNLLANAAKKQCVEVWATHDGHNNPLAASGADATDTDYTVYAKLKMGVITGLAFNVTQTGSAGAEVMNLVVSSTMAVDVVAVREVLNHITP